MRILIILTLLGLSSCSTSQMLVEQDQSKVIKRTQYIMGTQAMFYSEYEDLKLGAGVFAALKQTEATFSNYRRDSVLMKWQRGDAVEIPEEFDFLVNESVKLCEATLGRFNIKVGSLVKDVYNFKQSQSVPHPKSIHSSVEKIKNCSIDLSVKPKGFNLDFGAIGKGYGLDRARKVIEDEISQRASNKSTGRSPKQTIVALSGDIYCHNSCHFQIEIPPGQELKSPNGKSLEFTTCRNQSTVSTSGNYRQFIGDPGVNHLLDARTGKSQKNTASVTLVGIGPSYLIDAWTTIISLMNKEERSKLDNINFAWLHINNRGKVTRSRNFANFFCSSNKE